MRDAAVLKADFLACLVSSQKGHKLKAPQSCARHHLSDPLYDYYTHTLQPPTCCKFPSCLLMCYTTAYTCRRAVRHMRYVPSSDVRVSNRLSNSGSYP
ncbi:hypothetical protein XELAEV_18016799mg [Xenopus laevis]|uniref:Uncharacterized protein n=1 Tax=Xenopus laevis TaxID=8355 RepID=A0A974HS91_XENLA|nr:hypothetical protein XELAEV_18016799mg [Xenopus laevis]